MVKFPVLLFYITLLLGCTNNKQVTQTNQHTNQGYFSDASKCGQASIRKEKILVDRTVGVVEIPVGHDANTFVVCMVQAGRPVSRADATEYLNVSTTCLQQARRTDNLDESYANCIQSSRLDVEIITNE